MQLPAPAKAWRAPLGNAIVLPEATGTLHAAQVFVTLMGYMLATPSPGIRCVGSSDGTTAALDGVNRLIDKTKVVAANAGFAHSWIVLRWEATGQQVCFDFNSSTGAYLHTGTSSPGGLFVGGSTTAAPTATDGGAFKSTASSWLVDNAVGRTNLAVFHSVDGKNTYVMGTIAGFLVLAGIFGAPLNPSAGWTSPYVATMNGSTSPTGTLFSNVNFYTGGSRIFGWGPSGSMIFTLALEASRDPANGGGLGADVSTNANFLGASSDGCTGVLAQAGLYSTSTGMKGMHGLLPDIWVLAGAPVGTISEDPFYKDRWVISLGIWTLVWPAFNIRWEV